MNLWLVPGFMLDTDLWTGMRPFLEQSMTLMDVDTTQDASIPAMASRALRCFETPAFVLGFSMGGYVAREIAYQAPANIKGLILVATSARPTPSRFSEGATPPFRRLSPTAVKRSLHPSHQNSELIGRVQSMSERLGSDVFFRQSQLNRTGDVESLNEIRCPTLIVAAAQDQWRTLVESQELNAGINHAEIEVIEETGHLVPLEQPDTLARLVLAFCFNHGG